MGMCMEVVYQDIGSWVVCKLHRFDGGMEQLSAVLNQSLGDSSHDIFVAMFQSRAPAPVVCDVSAG